MNIPLDVLIRVQNALKISEKHLRNSPEPGLVGDWLLVLRVRSAVDIHLERIMRDLPKVEVTQ